VPPLPYSERKPLAYLIQPNLPMKAHLTLRVYGKVQGVFFRQSSKEKAEELGLTGFARNEPNGSVYLEAEGHAESLATFREWCQAGPSRARVSRVEAEDGEAKGYDRFEIRR
jgi:acylphosphatase